MMGEPEDVSKENEQLALIATWIQATLNYAAEKYGIKLAASPSKVQAEIQKVKPPS